MTQPRARRGPVDVALLTRDRRVALELSGAVTAQAVALIATIAWLLVVAVVIDGVFLGGRDLRSVGALLAGAAALLGVRALAVWIGEVLAARSSTRLRTGLRADLVEHLVAVGPAGLAHERVGELATTVGAGVDELDAYVARFVPAAAMAVIGPVLVFVVIGVLDPWTTLVLLFTGPMLVLLLAVIGRRTQALTRRRFDELGWLSAFYLDMIRGLGTLKAFRRSQDGAGTIEQVSRRYGDTTMEVLRTAFQMSLVMEWAAVAATALVAVEVSFRVIGDDLSFGTGLAVLVLTPEFFSPFRRLAVEYHAGQAGDAASARIREVEALPVTSPGSTGVTPPERRSVGASSRAVDRAPALRFEAVRYAYPGADVPALAGVDLDVEPGETLALVGPSGAGKTTVTRLLLRFMDPTGGLISVDGSPLDALDLAAWRRSVAWVPQDPTIIAGTVADNIRLGEPDASLDRVVAAADTARALGFVDALPDGMDTWLGEDGLQLSGGQRQRLAIARAALRAAPLVVLDEFTAHLDDDLEVEVRAGMAALLEGRTALVVVHRPATVALADRAVRLDRGRVVGPDAPAADRPWGTRP